MAKRNPKISRTALQTIADIVNGQLHGVGRVKVGKVSDKYAGNVVDFDNYENGAGEPVLAIFLRWEERHDND